MYRFLFYFLYNSSFTQKSPLFHEYFVRPVADGKFLLDNPLKMALEGEFHEADVLIGCSKDEGSIYAFGLSSTDYPSVNYSTYLGAIGEYLGLTDPLISETVAYMYAEEVEVKT